MSVRVGIIGAGHLGKIHARLIKSAAGAELAGVCDPRREAAQAAAEEANCPAYDDWRAMVGRIDAAILAAPTVLHHAIGVELLAQGIHLFVEKPLAASAAEGEALVRAADDAGRVLQVGHVERFNPAWQAALPHLGRARYIESARTSGFTFRSTDIGVVLDLMIHDLELILSLGPGPLERVDAVGISLFGRHEDIAQARLVFASGCVASLTASRASYKVRRSMQIYCDDGFADIDFGGPAARVIRPDARLLRREIDFFHLSASEQASVRERLFQDLLPLSEAPIVPGNAIAQEQEDFIASIRQGRSPQVDGRHAHQTLVVAERILNEIRAHRWDGAAGDLVGPLATPHNEVLSLPQLAEEGLNEARRRKAG